MWEKKYSSYLQVQVKRIAIVVVELVLLKIRNVKKDRNSNNIKNLNSCTLLKKNTMINKYEQPCLIKIIKQTYYNKRHISLIAFIVCYIFFSCSSPSFEDDLSLRKQINDSLYTVNYQLAKNRIKRIQSTYNLKNKKVFKMVHTSDPHLSEFSKSNHFKYPINLLQSVKFANETDLNFNALVITGDFISNHKDKNLALEYLESFTSVLNLNNLIPTFTCTGNHDSNIINDSFSSFITPIDIYKIAHTSSPQSEYSLKSQKYNHNYFYADVLNPQGGYIRFISLDMLDQPYKIYNTMYYASYSQEQINWLGNIALKENMTEQHSVIIMNHYPFQPHSPEALTYLCDGDYVHNWNMIPEIVESFRNKTSIKKSFTNKISEKDSINVNFDFSTSKGEFICYLGGHTHCFGFFNILGIHYKNKYLPPQQMILCTNQAPDVKGVVYNRVARNEDTLSSNSFNIYYIDTKDKKIYITFFGAYIPENDLSFPEIIVLSYK